MNDITIPRYSEIEIGQTAEVKHTITEEDIQSFGELSGDRNPLHFNQEWAEQTMFKGRIAHGLLTAAFVSTAIGMKLPGPGTIYVSQHMNFKRPVRIGDSITTKVEVAEKMDEKKHIKLNTTVVNQDGKTVLDGYAIVTLMRR
ncbi:MAG: MaoC family dehydratase [Candidatus Thorarchaeota archaeon]